MTLAFRWTSAHLQLRIAVVGANGATGLELCSLLLAAGHAPERLVCTARAARSLTIGHSTLPVQAHNDEVVAQCDLAFLCTPSGVSRELAPRLVARGVRVIDLSSALRMDPHIPLVVPEVNGDLLEAQPRLIANPNCTSAIALLPLSVIERLYGLAEVIVVSYQAASGAGS